MDVMEARRRLLMMPHGIDTSPQILRFNVRWNRGTLDVLDGYCVTVIYDVGFSTNSRSIIGYNTSNQYNIFRDGQYVDYWNVGTGREQVNANCNGISACIPMSKIEDAHLYFADTGEIIFAGRNSIYYGHKNISELE